MTDIYLTHLDGEFMNISVINLNSQDNKYNLFNQNLIKNLENCLNQLLHDDNTRVLIIRSLHRGIFSAGANVKEKDEMDFNKVIKFSEKMNYFIKTIRELQFPTIAAIDGHAIGGGLELVLPTDIRIVSSNAKLGLNETTLAFVPGLGGTQLLPRLIPVNIAKEMIFTGQLIDAQKALSIGLVNYCVEQNDHGDASFLKALEIAKKISKNAPLAVRNAKLSIDKGLEVPFSHGLLIESLQGLKLFETQDRKEAIKSFINKERPKYQGK